MKPLPPIGPEAPANDVLPRPSHRRIAALVGTKHYERARVYDLWGAVYDARAQGRELRARCEGSRGEAWRVAVRFGDDGGVTARCTCPVGERGDCKHVGAVLLAWTDGRADFFEAPTWEAALAALDAPALRAMLAELARRQPELDALLESLLPTPIDAGRPALPEDAWRARVGAIFRAHGVAPGSGDAVAEAVLRLLAEGAARIGPDAPAALGAMYGEVARAVLGRAPRMGDEVAPLRLVARRAVEGMARAARALADDTDARRALLAAMVDLLRFDIEQGVAAHAGAPGRWAVSRAIALSDEDDRAWLMTLVRDRMERADEWAHRAWMGVYVELLEGAVPDERWFALCRAWGRAAPMTRRLLALGRVDEAVAGLAQVGDGALLELAGAFVASGHEARFAEVVTRRMERASEANRVRLGGWLSARAAAHNDARAASDVAEQLFRARPGRETWDALREAARSAGTWDVVSARCAAHLESSAHPFLVDVLLDAGEVARAAAFATSPRALVPSFHAAREAIVRRLEGTSPREAAAVLRAQAEALVAQRARAHYAEACRALARARTLLARVGEGATADAWVEALRAKNVARPALLQLLDVHFGEAVRAAG